MLASTVGNFAALIERGRAGIEAIKWLALLLMVVDHLDRYVLHSGSPLPYLCGRLVFPLFAISMAVGLAARPVDHGWQLLRRLSTWGMLAQVAAAFAHGKPELNVLVTIGCGLVLFLTIQTAARRWYALPLIVGVSLLSCAAEFGPYGACMVAAALWFARAPSTLSAFAFLSGVALLGVINETGAALLAIPAAYVLLRWPIELPRVPHFFYWAYVGQWVLVWGLNLWFA